MGRRRTGGIDDRGNGRRYARVTLTLETGKTARRRVRIDAAAPTREARRISSDSIGYVFPVDPRPVASHAPSPPSVTVADYHDAWSKDRERRGRRTERGRYTSHVHPVCGMKPITEVTKNDVRSLAAALDDKVTAGALHALLACVDVPLRWRRLYASGSTCTSARASSPRSSGKTCTWTRVSSTSTRRSSSGAARPRRPRQEPRAESRSPSPFAPCSWRSAPSSKPGAAWSSTPTKTGPRSTGCRL
jgi:hypothetical protein